MERKSLLIVSATYATEENQKKLKALSRHFDVTCATAEAAQAFGLRISAASPAPGQGFRLVALPAFGAISSGTRYVLNGLGSVMRQRRYDIIMAECEPWSFIRWQTWWWKRFFHPKALFGEFSWENIERAGWKELALSLLYRAAISTDDFVIAGSEGAGRLFRKRGVDPARLLVAPQLGVDETLFAPASEEGRLASRRAMGIPPGCFLTGFCGRFAEFKGVLDLVDAVERARNRGEREDIHLALIGSGDLLEELRERQRERLWLHLLPPRPHPEVAGFMQALDLFVLPSREVRGGGITWREQFGHVLVEAMSCGVATLGSDSGAIPEVIGNPSHIFHEGDAGALAEGIVRIRGDPSLRAEMGRSGRARVLEFYTNEALSARWAAFLDAIPAKAHTPQPS